MWNQAEWGHTAGQVPVICCLAPPSVPFVSGPAGRLSASILPLGHPALGEAFCAATQSHVSCTSLDSDTEQMFRSLCGSEQCEETQRGSNAGQARILALQPYDNQESGI